MNYNPGYYWISLDVFKTKFSRRKLILRIFPGLSGYIILMPKNKIFGFFYGVCYIIQKENRYGYSK